MPNTRSAEKRLRQMARRRLANMSAMSRMKTEVKKASTALAAGDLATAGPQVRQAMKYIDKAVTKGVIHANAAARRKSRLSARLKAIS